MEVMQVLPVSRCAKSGLPESEPEPAQQIPGLPEPDHQIVGKDFGGPNAGVANDSKTVVTRSCGLSTNRAILSTAKPSALTLTLPRNLRPMAAPYFLLPLGEGGPKGRMRERDHSVPGQNPRAMGPSGLSRGERGRPPHGEAEYDSGGGYTPEGISP